ncbi:MAG: hypothetical protein F6K44_24840 [Moorea sp. SIO3E2]|nr:hypothetical protein [Moorena sp. SIO3E2]
MYRNLLKRSQCMGFPYLLIKLVTFQKMRTQTIFHSVGNRESGIGNRESGIGSQESR